MNKIHWLGAGLSSHPGIKRLAARQFPMVVWNRTLEKAEQSLIGLGQNACAKQLDLETFIKQINPGDLVVSMLPANLHPKIATWCLEQSAHFISSSYISPEMQALHQAAKDKNLCFVNEVGLDPGLDHVFAHALIDEYRSSSAFNPSNQHRFRSYCGGFPKKPNDFKYKFSWSPLGVLRALKSPARWLNSSQEKNTDKPWKALSEYQAPLQHGKEIFQAYPNRDSLPFISQYGIDADWRVDEFIRGTLRLNGWAQAWQSIFDEVESVEATQNSERLETLSKQLWEQYAYDADESDRVVLSVELEVNNHNKPVWSQSYSIDACGNEKGSAMARLVSYTVSLAVESTLEKQMPVGVSAAPNNPQIIKQWLQTLSDLGESIYISKS